MTAVRPPRPVRTDSQLLTLRIERDYWRDAVTRRGAELAEAHEVNRGLRQRLDLAQREIADLRAAVQRAYRLAAWSGSSGRRRQRATGESEED
jgi:hypothetical protein